MLENNYNSLKDRVWKSYKSRINSAERLKKKHNFIAFLSIYYSAVLSAVSILNYVNKSEKMDVFSIVLSVMVTILFIYLEGKNYKERYIKMKENYNKLSLLHLNIETAIAENKMEEDRYNRYIKQYTELLDAVENHLEVDYIKYAINSKDGKVNWKARIAYYCKYFSFGFIKISVTLIPTAVLGISLYQLLF